jgi:hypothetical protein
MVGEVVSNAGKALNTLMPSLFPKDEISHPETVHMHDY